MWCEYLIWTQSVRCKNDTRDICWLLGVTRPGMRTDDVDTQLVWRWQGEGKCLLDNSWQPTAEKWLKNGTTAVWQSSKKLDLQLQKHIFGKVESFQTDRSIELKRVQKGLWQYQTRSKTENNKHCCRFCQNCEWHSKVVVRGEKNKKCIVPTTSTANKELCFTGFPQHWSFFADIKINRLSVKLLFQTRRYVY